MSIKNIIKRLLKEELEVLDNTETQLVDNDTKVDVILMGGLDYRKGDLKISQQVEVLKSKLPNKIIVGYRYTDLSGVLNEIKNNPSAYVVLFSAGCANSSTIANSVKYKNKVFIVEPYAKSVNTSNSVKKAVSSGVPSRNVITGPDIYRGDGIVSGTTKTPKGVSHWGSLSYVTNFII